MSKGERARTQRRRDAEAYRRLLEVECAVLRRALAGDAVARRELERMGYAVMEDGWRPGDGRRARRRAVRVGLIVGPVLAVLCIGWILR